MIIDKRLTFRGEQRAWGYNQNQATQFDLAELRLHGSGGSYTNTLGKTDDPGDVFIFAANARKHPTPEGVKRKWAIPDHPHHADYEGLWDDVYLIEELIAEAHAEKPFRKLIIGGHSNGAKFNYSLAEYLRDGVITLPPGVELVGMHFSDIAILVNVDLSGFDLCPLVMSWGDEDSNTTEPAPPHRLNSTDGAKHMADIFGAGPLDWAEVYRSGQTVARQAIGKGARVGFYNDTRGHLIDKRTTRQVRELLLQMGETFAQADEPTAEQAITQVVDLGSYAGQRRRMAVRMEHAATATTVEFVWRPRGGDKEAADSWIIAEPAQPSVSDRVYVSIPRMQNADGTFHTYNFNANSPTLDDEVLLDALAWLSARAPHIKRVRHFGHSWGGVACWGLLAKTSSGVARVRELLGDDYEHAFIITGDTAELQRELDTAIAFGYAGGLTDGSVPIERVRKQHDKNAAQYGWSTQPAIRTGNLLEKGFAYTAWSEGRYAYAEIDAGHHGLRTIREVFWPMWDRSVAPHATPPEPEAPRSWWSRFWRWLRG